MIFKIVIFEKHPWAPSEVAKTARSKDLETQNSKDSKWKLIKNDLFSAVLWNEIEDL